MPLIGSPSFRIRPEWLWQELGHATDRLRQLGLRWPGLLRLEEIVLLWLDLVIIGRGIKVIFQGEGL